MLPAVLWIIFGDNYWFFTLLHIPVVSLSISFPHEGKMPSKSCPTTPVKAPKENAAIRDKTMTPSRASRKKVVEAPLVDKVALFETHSFGKPSIAVDKWSKLIYKIIQGATGALGGNGSTGAIYGELTIGSMQRVLNFLIEECELDKSSRFIDVGAGLGKPNFHAAQNPNVRLSVGIELEDIRYQVQMNPHRSLLTPA